MNSICLFIKKTKAAYDPTPARRGGFTAAVPSSIIIAWRQQ
jgi:hypothetical protein